MSRSLRFQNVISILDIPTKDLLDIVKTAHYLKNNPQPDLLKNKIIASCFFEASTRTRLSFEAAVYRLGGQVIGFDDGDSTSLAKKGETLSDSMKVIGSYADAIVIRHPQEGAARLAAEYTNIPVINGGDGSNQHPTQTLTDLFTIYECQKTLENLKIACVGDLKYGRTVHSLVQAMSHFNASFAFVAPKELQMPDYILQDVGEKGCDYFIVNSIEEAIKDSDIVYMTRIQKERFEETEYKNMVSKFIMTKSILESSKANMRILHPLPRVDEIAFDVDDTPFAYYFEQAANGVFARQGLLSLLLTDFKAS